MAAAVTSDRTNQLSTDSGNGTPEPRLTDRLGRGGGLPTPDILSGRQDQSPTGLLTEQETVNRTTAFATTAGRYAALPGNNNNNFILLLNRTESIQIKIKKKEKTVYTINNNNNNNRIYIAPYGRNFRVAGTLDNFVTAHALRGNPAHCPVTKEVMFHQR